MADKFGDIKVGDEVFIRKTISIGFSRLIGFWILSKVDRVTKTQFTVGKDRCRKDTGSVIGSHGHARAVGGEIVDQSKEYADTLARIKKANEIGRFIDRSAYRVDYSHENLDQIYDGVIHLKSLLEVNNG